MKLIPTICIYFLVLLIFGFVFRQQDILQSLMLRVDNLEKTTQSISLNTLTLQNQLLTNTKTTEKKLTALANRPAQVKTVIKEQRVEVHVPEKKPTLDAVITEWKPRMANVFCTFAYTNGVIYERSGGSGTYFQDGVVLTNKHVVTDNNGYGPEHCKVYVESNGAWTLRIAKNSDINIKPDVDVGFITVGSLPFFPLKRCSSKAPIGSSVVLLGFPPAGAKETITATDGIISGYEGSYYVTSAKIESGNSGGAAIDIARNCFLGIPTFVKIGNFETLGRILSVEVL